MAKFRPARGRRRDAPIRGGMPCLILMISGMILVALLLYMVLTSAT